MSLGSQRIGVAVRFRPLMVADGLDQQAAPQGARLTESGAIRCAASEFHFHTAAVCGSSQDVAFEELGEPLLHQLRVASSCTLLAYGQTGSGKTYTMFGPAGALTEAELAAAGGGTPARWGIFPRVALRLLQECGSPGGGALFVSAIELYHNVVFDLLADRKPLRLERTKSQPTLVRPGAHATPTAHLGPTWGEGYHGMHPPGCLCRHCFRAKARAKSAQREAAAPTPASRDLATNAARTQKRTRGPERTPLGDTATQSAVDCGDGRATESFAAVGETMWELRERRDVARIARLVEATRVAHSHLLNDRSSRSHCLVRLTWLAAPRIGGTAPRQRKQLLFVDLAGSERIERTGATGARLREATEINGSLTALGLVINRLREGDAYVPFRNSPLTMLLRSSLAAPGTLAMLVVHVASEPRHAAESLCSLQFGRRAAAVPQRGGSGRGGITTAATAAAAAAAEGATPVGSAAAAQVGELRREVAAGEARLRQLAAEGQAAHISDEATGTERLTLQTNLDRLDGLRAELVGARDALTEARGAGGATAALEARFAWLQSQWANMRDIVLRQKTIRGLWIPATPVFEQAAAQVRDLRNKLRLLELEAGCSVSA